jgi:hypothetical protein
MGGALMSVVGGIISLIIIETIISTMDTSSMPPALSTMVTTLIPIVMAASVVLGVFKYFTGDEDTAVVGPIKKYVRVKRWDQLGNRMKVAYEAKFGFASADFNSQVDSHVKAMRALGKGYTKSIDMEWMRRMAKFVEVPWIIPEEEQLAEVEKTRSFNSETPTVTVVRDSVPQPVSQVATPSQPSEIFNTVGGVIGLALAAEMSERTPVAKEAIKEPEFKPNFAYEIEVNEVNETPVIEPITDMDVEGLVDGEFANEPTPKMTPTPRKWSLRFWVKDEEKVPVRVRK